MSIRDRIIALDIGTKRIGTAVCDAMWLGATSLKVVERKDDKKAIDEIKALCAEYNTKKILIGVPYNMDGSLGFQAKNCLSFIEPLKNEYEILYQDERLTSNEAEEILRKQGKKYTKNKGLIDMASACVILQEYIDNNR